MTPPLISLTHATRTYGATLALDDVTLDLHAGEVTSILGSNGAGKTTLMHLVLGLVEPSGGTLRVLGGPAGAMAARRATGAMLQSAKLQAQLTARDLVEQFSSYYPQPRPVDEVLFLAGLEALANSRFGALSGGEQRRVQFALAICGRPALLVLDEPTTALDVEARRGLWRVVRELQAQGTTVLLSTHHLEEAEALSTRIVVLARGRIAADGTPSAIKARVAGRHVECDTSAPPDEVGRWPGVHRAERTGLRLRVVCEQAEPVVRALLDADPHLSNLTVGGSSLEEAVTQLGAAS